MIRFVVEISGDDPVMARRQLLEALEAGAPASEGYWHVRIKDFERVREVCNRYENDPTVVSQIHIAIRDVFARFAP